MLSKPYDPPLPTYIYETMATYWTHVPQASFDSSTIWTRSQQERTSECIRTGKNKKADGGSEARHINLDEGKFVCVCND